METISSRLENCEELKLSELVETKSVSETVATFLALLELIKRHKAAAEQILPFAEILIKSIEEDREKVSDVN